MKKLPEILAAVGGAVLSFFTGLPPIIWVLLAVMSMDYLSGILCAIAGKSEKTTNGGLSSGAAFMGLLKKMIIIFVVLLAALLDRAVTISAGLEFEAVAGATCLWFIASEGMSIIENAAKLGVPIPKILMNALELFRSKGGDQTPPENPENP